MAYVLVKYIHIAGIMVLAASLALEHMLVKTSMTPTELRRIAIADMVYGLSAAIVLAAGLVLWFGVGKGSAFYTHNPIFHAKVGTFILVGLASIYPTVFFARHRKATQPLVIVPPSVMMTVRVQLLLVLLLPLLAVLMAQGYGRM